LVFPLPDVTGRYLANLLPSTAVSIACELPRSLNPPVVDSTSGATENEFTESRLPGEIATTPSPVLFRPQEHGRLSLGLESTRQVTIFSVEHRVMYQDDSQAECRPSPPATVMTKSSGA
jgi:hypothetical protein